MPEIATFTPGQDTCKKSSYIQASLRDEVNLRKRTSQNKPRIFVTSYLIYIYLYNLNCQERCLQRRFVERLERCCHLLDQVEGWGSEDLGQRWRGSFGEVDTGILAFYGSIRVEVEDWVKSRMFMFIMIWAANKCPTKVISLWFLIPVYLFWNSTCCPRTYFPTLSPSRRLPRLWTGTLGQRPPQRLRGRQRPRLWLVPESRFFWWSMVVAHFIQCWMSRYGVLALVVDAANGKA